MRGSPGDTDDLSRKLDVVIGLLARVAACTEDRPSVADQIAILTELGVAPVDVGKALGKSANYVGAVLSKSKKRRARGGAK